MVYEGLHGDTYTSLPKLADAYGIELNTLIRRLNSGLSLEDALSSKHRLKKECIDPNGIVFESISSMCKAWNVPYGIYIKRIRRGWSTLDALTAPIGEKSRILADDKERKRQERLDSMAITCKGKRYKSAREFAKEFGITNKLVYDCIKNGESLDELVDRHNAMIEARTDHEGTVFKSIDDMCKHWGKQQDLYYRRLKQGMSKEEALTTPVITGKQLVYKDKKYESIAKLAKDVGISYNILLYRLSAGYSLEEAVKLEYKAHPLKCSDCMGNEYNSLSHMAKAWGIQPQILNRRLRNCRFDIVVALISRDKITLEYIGLDGKARYTLNGNKNKYYTARELIEKYRPDLLEIYDKYNPTGKYEPYNGGQ